MIPRLSSVVNVESLLEIKGLWSCDGARVSPRSFLTVPDPHLPLLVPEDLPPLEVPSLLFGCYFVVHRFLPHQFLLPQLFALQLEHVVLHPYYIGVRVSWLHLAMRTLLTRTQRHRTWFFFRVWQVPFVAPFLIACSLNFINNVMKVLVKGHEVNDIFDNWLIVFFDGWILSSI